MNVYYNYMSRFRKGEGKVRFSVIVPVYNSAAYLRECVDSVLGQTFGDFELVLVDDGSTDESPAICDEYAADPRVRIIHKANGGQFSARKAAIDAAAGDFVVPLDSDDALRRDALEIISGYLGDSGADMLIYKFSRSAGFDASPVEYDLEDKKVYEGDGKEAVYGIIASGSTLNSFCLKAYSLELLRSVEWDADFISRLRNGEDLMQLLPVVTAAKRIVFCDRILYYYRPNDSSASSRYTPELYDSRRLVCTVQRSYLEKWGLDRPPYSGRFRIKILRNVVSVVKTLGREEKGFCLSELRRIGSDEWGRAIYASADTSALPFNYKLILKLLYSGRAGALRLLLKAAK